MKILVVYYSRTGTIGQLAKVIANALGAEIEEIIYTKNMKGFLGFIRGGREAVTENPSKINPIQSAVENYDLLILGSPVWAGKLSSPATAFINLYKGKIKKLAVFLTHGDKKNSYDIVFSKLENKSGLDISAKLSLDSETVKSGKYNISAFIEKLK